MSPVTTKPSIQRPPPRIAFYLPALPAGGLEQVTLILVEELAAAGYRVDLVLERTCGAYLDRVPENVTLITLDKSKKRQLYRRLIRRWPREGVEIAGYFMLRRIESVPIRRAISLANYFDNSRPEVVISAAGDIPFLALWARSIASHRPKMIVAEHSIFSSRLEASRTEPANHRVLRQRLRRARRLYPRAEAMIAVSRGVAEDLVSTMGLQRDRIEVIYNPVVSGRLKRQANAKVDHDWLRDKSSRVVLAAGRLAPEKHFIDLVDAFAHLGSRRPEARLIIIGEGPERTRIEEHAARHGIADRVSLPGWVENPYAWMRQSDVFVLSSAFEGLGIALIEAMACGCPVVATDCPSGPREILEDGRFGRLVPVAQPEQMSIAIDATLNDPLPSALLKTRANHFNVPHAIDRYVQLIERVRAKP